MKSLIFLIALGTIAASAEVTISLPAETTAFKPYHLVVTETMQNGLNKEPKVHMNIKMLTDLEPEGILVPEKILIQAGLFNPSN